MSDADYDTIEAAVTETVRGRWFLTEFARRNRLAETRQLLEAMARLESAVSGGQTALPSADPSIRLLIQRIKEVAGQLGLVAGEMREAGIDERYVAAVDSQARAVSGMLRGATPGRAELQPSVASRMPVAIEPTRGKPAQPAILTTPAMPSPSRGTPRTEASPRSAPSAETSARPGGPTMPDPRVAALSGLDEMSLSEKLAFFT